ncbi:MAG: hypothetical protein FJ006_07100 [Chloroflexi bacterium]|nr:hypothetical protein [Chloroflexota bacterium]
MWAWFGSGKTHALRHIEYLCHKEFVNITPIYVEFPKSARNFLDIYRTFITGIDLEVLSNAYLEVFTSPVKDKISKELNLDFHDLSNALMFLYSGNSEQQETAIKWLRTECREKQVLKSIGISKPIQTVEDAIRIITWIIRIINMGGASSGEICRVLFMLDEYQRAGGLRKPSMDEVNGCLHSIFNRCPNGFSLIISFSGYPEGNRLPAWLSPEIRDRLDKKPLLLPPLSEDEALVFIKDILEHFRNPSSTISEACFPFTEESAYAIVKMIQTKKGKRQDEPKPRTIMHFSNLVLQEAEPLIERGALKIIDGDFVSNVLHGISLTEED